MEPHPHTSTCLAVAALAAFVPALFAQNPPGPAPGAGAPERGVARVSVANGEVSVRRGDSGDWVAAVVNAPLMAGDRVATGSGARAEIQFDSANLVRIGANAEIRLAEVAQNHYHLQIAHGTVSFRVLRQSAARVDLDTPPVSVRPLDIGAYRIFVQPDGQAEITVRLGAAEVSSPKGTERLQAGQTMLARGNPADPEFQVVQGIARDAWDDWNEQRDREMLASPSYNYVPHDMYGAEDLDNHGQWVDVPSYGEVWNPEVDPDWAPYQNGRWAWEDYYGWTWVSYDPWGWAPFHYGRWFYAAPYGWCWYPGAFGPHYWSPALVGFFGFGPGIGVGFGFGNVGWVALAPFEPMYAWWGRGFYAGFRNPAFFNRGVNITNVNITNVYRNARVPNGIASVSATDFRSGRFSNIARYSGAQIHNAGLVRGQLPVAPTVASLRFANRTVAGIPHSSENTRFFIRSTVAPVERVPFADQQRAMQTFSRQPASSTMTRSTPGSFNGAGQSRSVAPAASAPYGGGWRPVGQSEPQTAPGNANGGSGWQRFGEPRGANTASRPAYSSPGGYGSYSAPASGSGPQPLRVSPSLVREKSTQSGNNSTRSTSAPRSQSSSHSSGSSGSHASSGGGGHGGGGGGHR